MARTLADMTPGELRECIGMWADCNLGDMTVPLIFQGWELSDYPVLMDVEGNKFSTLTTRITPRFDLPRAWNPDGTPVEMEVEVSDVEYGRVRVYEVMSHDRVDFPEDTKVRRFVGEWEAADE